MALSQTKMEGVTARDTRWPRDGTSSVNNKRGCSQKGHYVWPCDGAQPNDEGEMTARDIKWPRDGTGSNGGRKGCGNTGHYVAARWN